MTRLPPPSFPDPSACPDDCAALIERWEAVLAKAPRLRPWLEEMIRQRRTLLHETARGSIERALWDELGRWLRQFEALPQFAVSAISVTLDPGSDHRSHPPSENVISDHAASPERALGEVEAMQADPAFALAFHCVEARLRPVLPGTPPAGAWFGLLHASAKPQPLLNAEVAVGLVLRALSADWQRLPPAARKTALRLFQATAGDLKATERILQLQSALPWLVDPLEFVAGAAQARGALAEACALCSRIAAATRPSQRGGLSVLIVDRAERATPAELAEVAETARKFSRMRGLSRLLSLL